MEPDRGESVRSRSASAAWSLPCSPQLGVELSDAFRANGEVRTLAQDADDLPVSGRAATPQWHSSMRFLVVSTTVVLNNALRHLTAEFGGMGCEAPGASTSLPSIGSGSRCLGPYTNSKTSVREVIWQLFFEPPGRICLHPSSSVRLVGFRLSLHITWHDPDVQRRLTTGSCCLRPPKQWDLRWNARLCMGILALLVLGLLQVRA